MYKFSSKIIFLVIVTITFCSALTWRGFANTVNAKKFYTVLTNQQDTVPKSRIVSLTKKDSASALHIPIHNPDTTKEKDTIPLSDSAGRLQKVDTFSFKISKDTLEAPVNYEAEDSAVILVQEKKVFLYGKTKTTYKDATLAAPTVELDQQTNLMTAIADRDSLGEVLNRAHFEQGKNVFDSDTIHFNFKTQKGITRNTFTNYDEMFIQGATIKKVNDGTIFISEGRITTCNLDDPHFAFKTNKVKVINNKIAVTGPTHPEFEGIPIPIYLPFGFFPMNTGRHSGFLPPRYTQTDNYGVGLQGLGYYKVLSDNWGATLEGDLYSYGGWNAALRSQYTVRYRYDGGLNFSVQHTKQNFKGDPDYSVGNTFLVNWTHSVNQKARPGTSFSAYVNAGSTKYNQNVIDDPRINFTNQLNSSISYSKNWIGKPYNLTLSVNHSQNSRNHLVNMTLPNATFAVSTQYPFQRKEMVGTPKWYEKLGIGYNGTFQNQFSFYDTAQFSMSRLLDTMHWSAAHNIPITLSLPPLGPLMVAPGISYSEVWLQTKTRLGWNDALKKLDTTTTKGLYTDRKMSFSLAFNTALYGTFQFKHSRAIALRHTVRPTASISYSPDLSKHHYYYTQVDTTGRKLPFSEIAGSYSQSYRGRFGGISFGVDNNLEMKWRSKKDTSNDGVKKIRLIDGFGFNSSYNLLADSTQFALTPFSLYVRSTLFEKININAQAILSPYKTDKHGQPIHKYAWEGQGFSLGQIQSGTISMSTSFQSKNKNEKEGNASGKNTEEENPNKITDPTLLGDQQRLMDYMRRNPAEFVDFNVPWQISLSFSLGFSRQAKSDYSGFTTVLNSSLTFNNSFSLTPKWNFSTNGSFDVKAQELQYFSMSINREMHCWQMSIGVTPIGPTRSFNFTISPKSGMLQDLKVNRTRYFRNY